RVISVQAILISSGYRKPMNHNPLKSLNSFSVRHLSKKSLYWHKGGNAADSAWDALGVAPRSGLAGCG
ncbi:hypothetical protein, partial [Acetobacter lambici]